MHIEPARRSEMDSVFSSQRAESDLFANHLELWRELQEVKQLGRKMLQRADDLLARMQDLRLPDKKQLQQLSEANQKIENLRKLLPQMRGLFLLDLELKMRVIWIDKKLKQIKEIWQVFSNKATILRQMR